VPYAKAIEVWHRCYPDLTPVTNADLGRLKLDDEYYVRHGDVFAHEDLFYTGGDEFRQLLEQQEGKFYYEPSCDELLRYADEFYYEPLPAFTKLLRFVRKERLARGEMAAELVEDIQLQCRDMGMTLDNIMFEFDRREIEFKDDSQFLEFMPLLIDLANHTRIWPNRGYTPLELSSLRGSDSRPS